MYDCIIIGCGPAGMTAVVYAARKKMNILLVAEEFGGQPMWTREIENYMGYQYISGPELMTKFEEQIRRYPLQIKYEKVDNIINDNGETFLVITSENTYKARTVIIASGKRPRKLQVPGEEEYTGRGVSYCATCDGPLFSGKTVAVVGGGNSAVQAAVELSAIAEKVFVVVRRELSADPVVIDRFHEAANIETIKGYEASGITGKEFVETFTVVHKDSRDQKELSVQGIFVEVGLTPNADFVSDLVDKNPYGEIIVNCRMETKTPGLFAAGDVTDGPDKQIVIAAGDGAKAALVAYEYLLYRQQNRI